MFCVVWGFSNSNLKGKQHEQENAPTSYKIEIKILANPRLAYLGFEQPGPGGFMVLSTHWNFLDFSTWAPLPLRQFLIHV